LLGPLAHHSRNIYEGRHSGRPSRPTQHTGKHSTGLLCPQELPCRLLCSFDRRPDRPAGRPGKQNRSVLPPPTPCNGARSSVSCVGHACFRRRPPS
jgi:hypothetical protein